MTKNDEGRLVFYDDVEAPIPGERARLLHLLTQWEAGAIVQFREWDFIGPLLPTELRRLPPPWHFHKWMAAYVPGNNSDEVINGSELGPELGFPMVNRTT